MLETTLLMAWEWHVWKSEQGRGNLLMMTRRRREVLGKVVTCVVWRSKRKSQKMKEGIRQGGH
jgi:hypothetical protein